VSERFVRKIVEPVSRIVAAVGPSRKGDAILVVMTQTLFEYGFRGSHVLEDGR
jgi:hypothetical protein